MLEQPVDDGDMQPVINPAEPKDIVGYVREATEAEVDQALDSAVNNAPIWFATPPQERAAILERAAVLMEDQMQSLIGILVREAVKPSATPSPKYARPSTSCTTTPVRCAMISIKTHRPLGPVVLYQPVELPLAIFTGQIAAALAAGNSVLAKPAGRPADCRAGHQHSSGSGRTGGRGPAAPGRG